VRFRRLEPDEDRSLATCNIVVMEFCDKGSLRHAMKRGVFHKRLGSTSVAVDLCAIVQVGRGCRLLLLLLLLLLPFAGLIGRLPAAVDVQTGGCPDRW
jgi:hypothetical protein